jgi:Tol biopolymer transport system component
LDVWLLDGSRETRFTFDPSVDLWPAWSHDGRLVVFSSGRAGPLNLFVKPGGGVAADQRMFESESATIAQDWSSDGRFLLYWKAADLWVRSIKGDPAPWAFLATPFQERGARFSPDGRWVVYESNESGRSEIYVRPFAAPTSGSAAPAGGQWQVSGAGGTWPVWRADGREIYYAGAGGAIMAAPVAVRDGTLDIGTPTALFTTRIFGTGVDTTFDVASDGRFLVNVELPGETAPITLIQNWNPR